MNHATQTQSNKYVLEMRKVSKRFPGTLAVDQVDFSAKPGEVHALMGENGAGKSTLMKMLAGSFDDYTGEILVQEKPVKLHTPGLAMQAGIAMIYQELSLAKPLSIAENMLVGNLPGKGGFVSKTKLMEDCRVQLQRVGLGYLDPRMEIEQISQHEAQLVEIAKNLHRNPLILVMDEPTSALSREEVARLFEIIRNLKQQGIAIIYISHHLSEVEEIADRVTVLRDGKHVYTGEMADTPTDQLVELMVGQKIQSDDSHESDAVGKVVFEADNISRYGFFHNVSFKIHKGEILGVCGLAGSGRSELARAIIGVDRIDHGKLVWENKQILNKNVHQALKRGMAYLSEDRKLTGLALRMSMADNALCAMYPEISKFGIYNKKKSMPILQELIHSLQIYPPEPGRMISNFSGGNQQKVLLGKWLALKPRLLILDEPTRGVDIGAKMLIHQVVQKLAENGNSVLLISSDLPELARLSDRAIVMKDGHIIGELQRNQIDEEKLLMAANGGEVAAG